MINVANVRVGLAAAGCSLVGAAIFLCGCGDRPPAPPRQNIVSMPLKTLTVAPDNLRERSAATAVEAARLNYTFRLTKLRDFYQQFGNLVKLEWANRELANLAQVRPWEWVGLPSILPPRDLPNTAPTETVLVEDALAARAEYIKAVGDLVTFYRQNAMTYKADVIANMQQRLDPIRTYMYFITAEVPPSQRKCDQFSSEADELFFRALAMHQQHKGLIVFTIGADYRRQRQSLELFKELIAKYPNSVRLPMAAFYIAEIYKEYFQENYRAATWYERAVQWDPAIQETASYQAAVLWDIRLHSAEKALELYQEALRRDPYDGGNVDFANKRIAALQAEVSAPRPPSTQPAPAEPAPDLPATQPALPAPAPDLPAPPLQ
ncbi:MAG: hypothetical protein ABFD92_11950 [Planctomycetaceae bacterium]|nr:hypothetical protein [Planctomycetaceae bacterium]